MVQMIMMLTLAWSIAVLSRLHCEYLELSLCLSILSSKSWTSPPQNTMTLSMSAGSLSLSVTTSLVLPSHPVTPLTLTLLRSIAETSLLSCIDNCVAYFTSS